MVDPAGRVLRAVPRSSGWTASSGSLTSVAWSPRFAAPVALAYVRRDVVLPAAAKVDSRWRQLRRFGNFLSKSDRQRSWQRSHWRFLRRCATRSTTIFQRLGVETAPDAAASRPQAAASRAQASHLVRGFAAMIGSFLFQATALGFGSLSVVQPLMVTELVFLVVILRVSFGSPLGWREAVGTVLTVAGLASFLADQQHRRRDHLSHREWLGDRDRGVLRGDRDLCRLHAPAGRGPRGRGARPGSAPRRRSRSP